MRKVFSVVICEREYDVYSIDGKKHHGSNNIPEEWWIYFSDRLPEDLMPPADSPHFRPFDAGILRRAWEIKIKQHNSTKEKWGDTDFRNSTSVEMWCNGKLVYQFVCGGKFIDFAMAKVQYMQVMLSEHCFDFFTPESENGRKIFWYGLPASVKTGSGSHVWEISIIPDYTQGLDKESWWEELRRRMKKIPKEKYDDMKEEQEQDFLENMRDDCIRWGDAFSDQHIDWFRD